MDDLGIPYCETVLRLRSSQLLIRMKTCQDGLSGQSGELWPKGVVNLILPSMVRWEEAAENDQAAERENESTARRPWWWRVVSGFRALKQRIVGHEKWEDDFHDMVQHLKRGAVEEEKQRFLGKCRVASDRYSAVVATEGEGAVTQMRPYTRWNFTVARAMCMARAGRMIPPTRAVAMLESKDDSVDGEDSGARLETRKVRCNCGSTMLVTRWPSHGLLDCGRTAAARNECLRRVRELVMDGRKEQELGWSGFEERRLLIGGGLIESRFSERWLTREGGRKKIDRLLSSYAKRVLLDGCS